jgi:hypothetical protein
MQRSASTSIETQTNISMMIIYNNCNDDNDDNDYNDNVKTHLSQFYAVLGTLVG